MAKLNLRTPNGYDGAPGTTHKMGIVRFATNAEATAGVMNNVALTPSQGALISVPLATTAVAGKVQLSTNAQAVTGSDATTAVTPAALTARLAAPGAIGGTTPGAGNFTTVNATSTITAGTTLTATLGNITATNGNIVRGTAGNKDVYSSVASTTTAGANSAGTVTLVSGTATVATTAVTANSQIRLYRQGIGATGAAALGILTIGAKSAGVSFVINAVQAAAANANQTTDVSVIGWEIVN